MLIKNRPFDWINHDAQQPLLVSLTVLVVCMTALLFWLDRALVTNAAPNGIVSFELARSLERSGAILQSWSQHAKSIAMLVQGIDYLYLLVYPAWFSLASDYLGKRIGGSWQRSAFLTSWLVLLAIPLDAIENFALIQQLLYGPTRLHAGLAWWCAVPKFALVALAGAFVFSATCALIVKRFSN